jgi:hypothetical protein
MLWNGPSALEPSFGEVLERPFGEALERPFGCAQGPVMHFNFGFDCAQQRADLIVPIIRGVPLFRSIRIEILVM